MQERDDVSQTRVVGSSGGSVQQLDFGCISDVARKKKSGGYSSALARDLKRNASII